jgi:dTDP-4-amino-4,6-dideoxygalactose transaminase
MAIPRQRIHVPRGAFTGALSSLLTGKFQDGPEYSGFEQAFANSIGSTDAIAVPSGRAGFKFTFDALNLDPGAEVICSAFGYPIVPFLVKSLGYKVRFVDCEERTLGLDPDLLADSITDNTQAVIATHLYGVPCRIDEIETICRARGLKLIEDCAHCFGAAVGDRKVGTFGDAACFSFETSKVINTMGGGMVTVQDAAMAERVRAAATAEPHNGMRWLFRRLFKTSFEAVVTNPLVFNLGVYQALRIASRGGEENDRFASGYHGDEVSMAGKMGRFTNYQARLGMRQIPTADAINDRRNANAIRLHEQLDDIVRFQKPASDDVSPNYMLVTTLMPNAQQVAACLLRAGVDTKRMYMRDCSRMFEDSANCELAAVAERDVLHLPAHPQLSDLQIDRVAATVRKVLS